MADYEWIGVAGGGPAGADLREPEGPGFLRAPALRRHSFRDGQGRDADGAAAAIGQRADQGHPAHRRHGGRGRFDCKPVLLKKAVAGSIGHRLESAVLREALHLLSEGMADAPAIDLILQGLMGPRPRITGTPAPAAR